jgi:hypothetical protein
VRFSMSATMLRWATVCLLATSMLGNPIPVLCAEHHGRTAIESIWFPCCEDNGSNYQRMAGSSLNKFGAPATFDGDPCLDSILDLETTLRHRTDGTLLAPDSAVWLPVDGAADANAQPLDGFDHEVRIGHSGSALVALRTVRLLT